MNFNKIFLAIMIVILYSFLQCNLLAASEQKPPDGLELIYGFIKGEIYSDIGIFYEDQPFVFRIYLNNSSSNIINIGRDDWYNAIDVFSVTPKRVENDKIITEKERKVTYKIIKSENLIDGKLNPGEEKSIYVEVYDENGQLFEAHYSYRFFVKISFIGI